VDTATPVKLSIIVPLSSKREDLSNLECWLNTLREHEYLDYEVILVLDIDLEYPDSSIENTISNLQNPKVTILRGNFGSPGYARNVGLKNASGSHVCFWDADDTPYLANIFRHLLKNPGQEKIVVGDYILHHLKKNHEIPVRNRSLVELGFSPGIWRFIFPRERIYGLQFPNLSMGEDQVFFLKIKVRESEIFWSHEDFYKYFIGNSSQLTQNKVAKKDLKNSILEVLNLFESENRVKSDVSRDVVFWRLFFTCFKNQDSLRDRISLVYMVWQSWRNMKIPISFFRPVKFIINYQTRIQLKKYIK
jgi:glycosyltransferase involved in cell wall biosynthesis